jgi:hypothetical protein
MLQHAPLRLPRKDDGRGRVNRRAMGVGRVSEWRKVTSQKPGGNFRQPQSEAEDRTIWPCRARTNWKSFASQLGRGRRLMQPTDYPLSLLVSGLRGASALVDANIETYFSDIEDSFLLDVSEFDHLQKTCAYLDEKDL